MINKKASRLCPLFPVERPEVMHGTKESGGRKAGHNHLMKRSRHTKKTTQQL